PPLSWWPQDPPVRSGTAFPRWPAGPADAAAAALAELVCCGEKARPSESAHETELDSEQVKSKREAREDTPAQRGPPAASPACLPHGGFRLRLQTPLDEQEGGKGVAADEFQTCRVSLGMRGVGPGPGSPQTRNRGWKVSKPQEAVCGSGDCVQGWVRDQGPDSERI
ncbi:hypothetical protein H1C71_007237, partial [Ictidomys tridecemlineatus]